ncbi:MAG: tetratricopeptide repeat protein [Gemmatimonadota bacterium]|nr:tetratricopeptide repeat protein [Gemmatimonadota bacterium]
MTASDQRFDPGSTLAGGEAAEQRGDYVQAAAAYAHAAEDPDPAVAAEALYRLGRVEWRQGRYERAVQWYEKTRMAARAGGRRDLEARAENGIGAVHYSRGEYAQARASYQVAMERTDDPVLIGQIMLNLGVIANIEGNLENALWHYLRARALFRDNGNRGGEALALHNLGMVYADRQEWEAAGDAYEQCLGLCEYQGNRPMIAKVLLNQAEVFVARMEFARAVRNCEISMSISVDVGDEVERGEAYRWMGYAYRMAGDHDAAERALTEAAQVAQRFRVKLLEAEASRELWEVKRARGDADAGRWRERALALFRDLGAQREVDALESQGAEGA